MSNERARDLAVLCTELVRKGEDFPTVWATVLKGHALVNGIPESKLEGSRPVLEIKLITGERLCSTAKAKNSASDRTNGGAMNAALVWAAFIAH